MDAWTWTQINSNEICLLRIMALSEKSTSNQACYAPLSFCSRGLLLNSCLVAFGTGCSY